MPKFFKVGLVVGNLDKVISFTPSSNDLLITMDDSSVITCSGDFATDPEFFSRQILDFNNDVSGVFKEFKNATDTFGFVVSGYTSSNGTSGGKVAILAIGGSVVSINGTDLNLIPNPKVFFDNRDNVTWIEAAVNYVEGEEINVTSPPIPAGAGAGPRDINIKIESNGIVVFSTSETGDTQPFKAT